MNSMCVCYHRGVIDIVLILISPHFLGHLMLVYKIVTYRYGHVPITELSKLYVIVQTEDVLLDV